MKKQSTRLAFDNAKYLKIQEKEIKTRIESFEGKLYLEFGGKLFDDYHASRVLPGFHPDAKLQLLLNMKKNVEVVIAVNAKDISSNKVRADLGISYDAEVFRLVDAYKESGLYVSSVVLTQFEESPLVDEFTTKIIKHGIKVYKHYKIAGYPQNINLICSDDGLGKNEYIETSRPLVVVTAPGPGSGKLATCLSQLYADNKHGIKAGYAKYETFPIWNIPLKDPVNLAYEAATADLNDVNMIDPFHLEAYGKMSVNYNRDIEAFPLLKSIFERIYGKSPYNSPTDMGVNMVGFAITDEEAAHSAAKKEIVRRYYEAKKLNYLGKYEDECVAKEELILSQVGMTIENRKCVAPTLKKAEETGEPCFGIELPNGKVITGKRSDLFGASASCLINALKTLAKIDDSYFLLPPGILAPIKQIKVDVLNNQNPRIRVEEILLTLSIAAASNPLAEKALEQLPKLRGCQAHSSLILSNTDLSTWKKLGVNVTEEPISYLHKLYIGKNN